MPWLKDLVEANDSSLEVLPVQCLCEFLLLDLLQDDKTEDDGRTDLKKKQVGLRIMNYVLRYNLLSRWLALKGLQVSISGLHQACHMPCSQYLRKWSLCKFWGSPSPWTKFLWKGRRYLLASFSYKMYFCLIFLCWTAVRPDIEIIIKEMEMFSL